MTRAVEVVEVAGGSTRLGSNLVLLSSLSSKAVTSVVGDDGDYPLTEAGVASALAVGGRIFVRGSGTLSVTTGWTFADKHTSIEFDPRITVSPGSNAISVFTVPASVLTARRWYVIRGLRLTGGLVANQDAVKLNDANSRGKVFIYDAYIDNIECLANFSAGELAYAEMVEVKWFNCYLPPPNMATPKMLKSKASGWGTTDYGIQSQFNSCQLAIDLTSTVTGWTMDFEGDLEFNECWNLALKGDSRCLSWGGLGQLSLFGVGSTPSIEINGTSAWNTAAIFSMDVRDGLELKLNGRGEAVGLISKVSVTNAAWITVDDPGWTIGLLKTAGTLAAVCVDVLATGTGFKLLNGTFGDATTAAISTASTGGQYTNCVFASTAARLTFRETGAADSNMVSGGRGIGTGGGATLLGASTRIDGVQVGMASSGAVDSIAHAWARMTSVSTEVGNVGAGTDDLQTFSVPAKVLNLTGRTIRVKAWGRTANNGNAKTVTLNFGSQIVMTQALTAGIAGTWRIDCEVIKTGSNMQRIFAELLQLATIVHTQTATAGTQTDTAAITVKCTGAATANDDIVQEGMIVEVS
jgi:hypothetical protein